ncbi:uncharacterized protein DUF1800 [Motilibacter rhizosphaerae]|uniref:Uncharacterized protein DUF1800 n=1 Tax=Motilibacter rhizosphaerae TaxID=598652 RepID=A0A4Q7NY07_9ACTN|nr:DUF1800 domain-containing protein [Motilibacter rhizosphaerae]RZS91272.1 uncharacterized protein DUF1800 [Motilibacter rhizosphaerae]
MTDLLHLLRRTTYGPTPALLAEVERTGPSAWLAQQLAPSTVTDPVGDRLAKRFPQLQWPAWKVREVHGFDWTVMLQLRDLHTARAVWSRRQLLEVLVDVWSNALNVPNPSSDVSDVRHLYDRDVIRRHALGRFEDLLVAAVTSPAMLRYLAADQSTGRNPNENLGRELLELHTVGRASGFTEHDVRQSALVLTGLTVGSKSGQTEYAPQDHWVGPVRVLGFRHPNASAERGREVAEAYLRYLARHPLTARHVATRLAVRFVSDAPSPALVRALARTYTVSGTAVLPVLRQLLGSREFLESGGQKVLTPFQDLVATARVLGVSPPRGTDFGSLGWWPDVLGQPPLGWPRPDGYPDVAAAWAGAGTTLARWNAHLALAAGWDSKLVHRKPESFLPRPLPATHGELVRALGAALLVPLAPAQVDALCGFVGKVPASRLAADDPAVTWRLASLLSLVLDTPQAALR